LGNTLDKVLRPTQTKSSFFWGIIILAIIDIPLFIFLLLGYQGFSFLLIIIVVILVLVDGLVLSLSFLGKRMSFRIRPNDFLITLGFSKRKIPYSTIKDVKISKTTLVLRLFGASWPGLHWGLYRAKNVGNIWAYSTKITGEFVIIELVDGKKVAVSPENPKLLLDELNSKKHRFDTTKSVEAFGSPMRIVYFQVASVAAAFLVFLGYLLWIYPQLPEIIPVHFDFNFVPNRWGHKSELFLIAGIAAIFPIMNSILVLKFGKYAKSITIFLGLVFISVIVLFFGIVYFTQSII
jgi:uncharacterized membrane protein